MTYVDVEMKSEEGGEFSSTECGITTTIDLTDEVIDNTNFRSYQYEKMTCDEPVFKIEKIERGQV